MIGEIGPADASLFADGCDGYVTLCFAFINRIQDTLFCIFAPLVVIMSHWFCVVFH
jgi:hypothetical protein